MKKNAINSWASICFYVCSVVFYLLAIHSLTSESFDSTTIIYLSLGATFMCLGAVKAMISRKKK